MKKIIPKLEEIQGSEHCQYSVIENKLAALYRNQLKIYEAIALANDMEIRDMTPRVVYRDRKGNITHVIEKNNSDI